MGDELVHLRSICNYTRRYVCDPVALGKDEMDANELLHVAWI